MTITINRIQSDYVDGKIVPTGEVSKFRITIEGDRLKVLQDIKNGKGYEVKQLSKNNPEIEPTAIIDHLLILEFCHLVEPKLRIDLLESLLFSRVFHITEFGVKYVAFYGIEENKDKDFTEIERDRSLCIDCRGKCFTGYMLKDEIWLGEIRASKDNILCLICVEKRLNRRLKPSDFRDAPISRELIGILGDRE